MPLHPAKTLRGIALAALLGAGALVASPVGADAGANLLPREIPLPNGFQPEGIERGPLASFYVSSLTDGAIYRGSLLTGKGRILVPGVEGRAAFGIERDARHRLFVPDGPGGGARVYNAHTGRELASYQLTAPGGGLIHDVVVTSRAAYFTDSLQPLLHVVPIRRDGRLGGQNSVRSVPLSGDLVYEEEGAGCPAVPELNLTGIEASPDGRGLLAVQFNTGKLFTIDPRTGASRAVDLGGTLLACGNSLLREGHELNVVQPVDQQVSVLELNHRSTSARVERTITHPSLDFPTAAVRFGASLFVANARFATEPTPDTRYTIVRVP